MSTGSTAARTQGGIVAVLRRNFYVAMAIFMGASIIYGFAQTAPSTFRQPPFPIPWILFVHAFIFVGWLAFFITQTALIRSRNLRLHRALGTFGLVFGAMIPVVALAVSLVWDRLRIQHNLMDDPQFLAIQFNDIIGFTMTFALAAWLRKKPDYHRRLMFLSLCYLADAGFDRWPMVSAFFAHSPLLGFAMGYLIVDALVVAAMARDWIVDRRIGLVYRYGLPALIATQSVALILYFAQPPWWLSICHAFIGA